MRCDEDISSWFEELVGWSFVTLLGVTLFVVVLWADDDAKRTQSRRAKPSRPIIVRPHAW
jgi:hypothetical protein